MRMLSLDAGTVEPSKPGLALLTRVAVSLLVLGVCAGCTAGGTARPQQTTGVIPEERVSTDDALPEEFPSDMPLPAGSTVLYSAVGPYGVVAYFASDRSDADVKRFMLARLADQGWTLHQCDTSPRDPEPVTILVASKDGQVATVVVGYSPENAARIEGRDYAFFVSVTTTSKVPEATTEPC